MIEVRLDKSRKIERRVFRRWVNARLKPSGVSVSDLEHGLSRGSTLLALVEVLSHRRSSAESLGDVESRAAALAILREEGLYMGDIGLSDNIIVRGRLRHYREFVWRLIVHYTIKKNIIIKKDKEEEIIKKDFTPKKFLKWLNSKLNGVVLTNFCSDWNNGVAIGILVNIIDRDLCIDVQSWDVNSSIKNTYFAMEAALHCLGIEQLLKPGEMADEEVSERAVMTYVAQFIDLLKESNLEVGMKHSDKWSPEVQKVMDQDGDTGALAMTLDIGAVVGCSRLLENDIRDEEQANLTDKGDRPYEDGRPITMIPFSQPIDNIIRNTITKIAEEVLGTFESTLSKKDRESEMFIYGPGLLQAVAGYAGIFIFETKGVNKHIGFVMEGPSEAKIECSDLGNGTVKVRYVTGSPGLYELSIIASDLHICSSPHLISVLELAHPCDYSNVLVEGLEDSDLILFTVDLRLTNQNITPDIQCFDNLGLRLTKVQVEELEPQLYLCRLEYVTLGRHIIFASCSDIQLQGFPHVVYVTSSLLCETDRKEESEGGEDVSLEEKCLEILDEGLVGAIEVSVQEFFSELEENSTTNIESNILLDTASNKIKVTSKLKDIEEQLGLQIIGSSLNGSPIECNKLQTIVIYMTEVNILGMLEVSLEGPSDTNLQCHGDELGRCTIEYFPSLPGTYEFAVALDGVAVQGSPFIITVCDRAALPQFQSQHSDNDVITCEPFSRLSPSWHSKIEKSHSYSSLSSSSSSSSEEEAVNSIPSGIYVAKIVRVFRPEVLDDFGDSDRSVSTSTSMEIGRLSWNYEESLNNFYDNMLSAFTNLIVLDILLVATEEIATERLESRLTPDVTSCSEDSHTIKDFDLSSTLVNSATVLELQRVNSSSRDTTGALSNSSIDSSLSAAAAAAAMSPLCCDYSHCQPPEPKARAKHLSDCEGSNNGAPSTVATQLTLSSSEQCQKSVAVDLCSSLSSSSQTAKASAEVIFDSLSINISEQISVYNRPLLPLYRGCLQAESSDGDCGEKVAAPPLLPSVSKSRRERAAVPSLLHSVSKPRRERAAVPSLLHSVSRPRTDRALPRDVRRQPPTKKQGCSLTLVSRRRRPRRRGRPLCPSLSSRVATQRTLKEHAVSSLRQEEGAVSGLDISIECYEGNIELCSRLLLLPSLHSHRLLTVTVVKSVFAQETVCRHRSHRHLSHYSARLNNKDSQTVSDGDMVAPQEVTAAAAAGGTQRDCGASLVCVDKEAQTSSHLSVGSLHHQDNESNRPLNLGTKAETVSMEPDSSSQSNIKDISLAVETLVDTITNIAKDHIVLHPSRHNIKKVEELIGLLPRLIVFGKQKKLYQINYLTDRLESILLKDTHSHIENHCDNSNNNRVLNQIIKCIKNCIRMDKEDFGSKHDGGTEQSREVHAVGPALEEGKTHFDNHFMVYTKSRVPGSLSISLEGPSKAKIDFVDQRKGLYVVCYHVTIPGEYICSITYNMTHILNSPFKIKVSGEEPSSELKLSMNNINNASSQPHNESDTRVVMLPMGRNIVFHLSSKVPSALTCFMTGDLGVCRYLPIERDKQESIVRLFTADPGVYNLDFFNSEGERIGRPWVINVTNMGTVTASNIIHCNVDISNWEHKQPAEMSANIFAYGDGLRVGKTNSKNMFFLIIDHEYEGDFAEDPSLNVTIDGPSKVELSCTDDSLGYTFWYLAKISGTYFISIRYSKQYHIAGSPFKVEICS